jgi:hypothetical protein
MLMNSARLKLKQIYYAGVLRHYIKIVIFTPMHFSRHISQSHSTASLLAALKLRVAR